MPRLLWPLLLALMLGACASHPADKQERSEAAQYHKAVESMSSRNYSSAIEQLKQLKAEFPYGRYAEQAQLDLIYSHFRDSDYPETVAAAQRFATDYPASPHMAYALYMRGLANFYMNKSMFDSIMRSNKAARDLSSARDAFNDFQKLVSRFPNSHYTKDARSRMVYIRNELAAHEMDAARYYARRGAYLAAINRAQYVVQHYQRTPQVPEALAIMVKGYTLLGEPQLAAKSRRVLAANWPDSPYLIKDLNDDGGVNLAWWPDHKHDLLDLLTFDLL